MTILNNIYFTYDGIDCRDMGVINVTLDTFITEPFLPEQDIYEVTTRRESPYFQRLQRNPLTFNLNLAFKDGFDNDMLREAKKWLSQETFKKLIFSDQEDRIYWAMCDGAPKLYHVAGQGYIDIVFRCNSPYAYGDYVETDIYELHMPDVTYERDLIIIHPESGEVVPENIPVFLPFYENRKGLLMSESETDLINFRGGPDNALYDTVFEPDYILDVDGNEVFSWKIASTTTVFSTIVWHPRVVPGNEYEFKIYVYNPDNVINWLELEVWMSTDDDDPSISLSPFLFSLGNGYYYYSFSFTVPDGELSAHSPAGLKFVGNIGCGNVPYWIYGVDVTTPQASSCLSVDVADDVPEEFGVGLACKMEQMSGVRDHTFWLGERMDGALGFDGVDDYVSAAVSGLTMPFDVEFDIKVSSIPSSNSIIFVHAQTGAGCGFYNGNSFILRSGPVKKRLCDLSNFKAGAWNNIKIFYDLSGNPSVLINGKEPGYLSENQWTETSTNDLLIGKRSTGNYCKMEMKNFRFIKDGMDFLNYNMDEGLGSVVTDTSNNNYHGTIYGATWVDITSGYMCFYDSIDDKIKLTNGVDIVEIDAVWGINDIVGVYAGMRNGKLFIQGKVAGILTDIDETDSASINGIDKIIIGSNGKCGEYINGVIASYVYHDSINDINPLTYLSMIPGGGAP